MYFDFDYYKDKKVVIHCNSKTQAKKWCKLMHKNGLKWRSGSRYYEKSNYNRFGCYSLRGTMDSINYWKWHGYTIIEFEDIITGKYEGNKHETRS